MATTQTTTTTAADINAQLVTLSQKYLGNSEFVLSGTATGYIGAEVTPLAPYTNLTNRYYPTVATLPQLSSNIVTKGDLGGYFTPNNLGISTYQTKEITSFIDSTKIQDGSIYKYIDPSRFNKGRSLTKKDQDNIIKHVENTDWMKGSNTDTTFDGQVKNSELYQKFIPYQSNIESQKTDTNGVITVKDDFEYWTGSEKNIWLQDNKYTEQDWLKYFSLNKRDEYLLITANRELYSWHSDVYGNQYGLYKPVVSNRTIYGMQNACGQLWVKTVDGSISQATQALSAIYKKYADIPVIYEQLSGNNIKNFEVFFDTLVIELSSHVLLEKIKYDYTDYTIVNTDAQYLNVDLASSVATRLLSSTSLTGVSLPATSRQYYGGIWYNEPSKKFTVCLLLSAGLVGSSPVSGIVVPVLYEYNLNDPANRQRIYPTNDTNYSEYFYNSAATLNDLKLLTYIEPPVLTYNYSTNSYYITFIGYVDQNFKIINYTTGRERLGRVIVNENTLPIVTNNNIKIQAV
jgi:hypothetical protein